MVVTGILPVATAWLTKLVLDLLTTGASAAKLIAVATALAGAAATTSIVPHLVQYVRTEMDRRVALLAQERLFTAVGSFAGLRRFEDPRFLDQLRLADQAGRSTPSQTVISMLQIVRLAVTVVGFLGSLLLLSPLMALLVLLAGVPMLLAELRLSRHRAHMFWAVGPAERREIFYSQLLTGVDSAKEVRLFGIGAFLRGRMLSERRATDAAKRSVDRRTGFVQTGLGLLAALVSGSGLIWAVDAARTGALSVGGVTMFVAAVAGVQSSLVALIGQVAGTHQALLMFDHYMTVTSAGPDLPVPAVPRPVPTLRYGIELRDVWFRYSDEHPWVLRGVDLFIPHGTAVALVGLNGAGKSTLVKLMCRFYDPTRGAILWDGEDLRNFDPAELRERIGAVFQDYMHYDMTAAENVALGDLAALGDRDRLQGAARRAGIHDTLEDLPQGYDTLLSRLFFMESDKDDPETGVVLSGGQWQRLALARAFLRDQRDLLILDEPSAGLDAEAEAEIHAALREHRCGRTSLLVSHRLGALRDADSIVVLADGRVVEQGDHAALMAAEGAYARLFLLQASGYQDEADAPVVMGGLT
ncbi:ABC transporter ATP-binding protein [Streptomyces sp. NPDC014685]|uniref:ABC transporter ATP-binding protein n=1 Tax=Streptomyces sp. NPDC014685 TaxID=3364881 RepID=UPI0036F637D0